MRGKTFTQRPINPRSDRKKAKRLAAKEEAKAARLRALAPQPNVPRRVVLPDVPLARAPHANVPRRGTALPSAKTDAVRLTFPGPVNTLDFRGMGLVFLYAMLWVISVVFCGMEVYWFIGRHLGWEFPVALRSKG
ncbi:hypothetical protein BDZ45DRAFT_684793 [Acephala macrosclerotiorum]|nr:hypothetical protein BDZ45DRAFT_684793 [Acephala macrosclerotiorum]